MNTMTLLARANPINKGSLDDLRAELPGPPTVERIRAPRARQTVPRLAAAGLVVAAIVATPALALRSQISQTLHDFLAGSAPTQAKQAVRTLVAGSSVSGLGQPDQVELVMDVSGPQGGLQLYKLHFANGAVGATIVDTGHDPARVSASFAGPPRSLASGQTIDVRGSGVQDPGVSPYYFEGIIGPEVATVALVDSAGRSFAVKTGGDYMLGWIVPRLDGEYGDSQLVARNVRGDQVGRVDVCTVGRDVQFRTHTPGMPADVAAACAIPPTPDNP
jgi:hypothetical protein